MPKNYSITDVEGWKFEASNMPDLWTNHLGNLHKNFRILIKGEPKNGKTEYLVKLMKALAQSGMKIHFNSTEQGKSPTLQAAFQRNMMSEVKGKVMLADKSQNRFDTWFEKLQKRNIGHVIVLDSIDYMQLTFDQWKKLNNRFQHKSFILVSWDKKTDIEYQMDAIVRVKNFVAKPVSRMGGNTPMVIWDKKSNGQANLFSHDSN